MGTVNHIPQFHACPKFTVYLFRLQPVLAHLCCSEALSDVILHIVVSNVVTLQYDMDTCMYFGKNETILNYEIPCQPTYTYTRALSHKHSEGHYWSFWKFYHHIKSLTLVIFEIIWHQVDLVIDCFTSISSSATYYLMFIIVLKLIKHFQTVPI